MVLSTMCGLSSSNASEGSLVSVDGRPQCLFVSFLCRLLASMHLEIMADPREYHWQVVVEWRVPQFVFRFGLYFAWKQLKHALEFLGTTCVLAHGTTGTVHELQWMDQD